MLNILKSKRFEELIVKELWCLSWFRIYMHLTKREFPWLYIIFKKDCFLYVKIYTFCINVLLEMIYLIL